MERVHAEAFEATFAEFEGGDHTAAYRRYLARLQALPDAGEPCSWQTFVQRWLDREAE